MKQLPVFLILLMLAGCKAETNDKYSAATNRMSMENRPGISAPTPEAKAAKESHSNTQTQGAPVPTVEVVDPRPVIVCFGDSLTAGYGTDPGQSYPDYLQKLLDNAGYKYHVMNEGVSGDTTKDGLARVAHIAALKPEWVIVEFGGNDGLRGLPVGGTKTTLTSIVNGVRQSGAKVLLAGISLPPQYTEDYIKNFNGMYPAIAKQTSVPLVPMIYKDVYGVAGDIQDDGVHATAKGNQQVAKNVGDSLMPLLRK